MKRKINDINLLLLSLIAFSITIGIIHTLSSKEKIKVSTEEKVDKSKEEKKQPTSSVPEPPIPPAPPAQITPKPEEEEALTIEEIVAHIPNGTKNITTFLKQAWKTIEKEKKETYPKKVEKFITIVTLAVKKKFDDLLNPNKLNLIFSLADYLKEKKEIQNELFNMVIHLKHDKIPVLALAITIGKEHVIPDFLAWLKAASKKHFDSLQDESLTYAASRNNLAILEKLNKYGVEINKTNATKLLRAAVIGNKGTKCLQFLCRLGADVNQEDPKTQKTILMNAIENDNLTTVKILIERCGADVKKTSSNIMIGSPIQFTKSLLQDKKISSVKIEMYLFDKGATY